MRTVTAATTPNHLRFVYATDFWLYGAFQRALHGGGRYRHVAYGQ